VREETLIRLGNRTRRAEDRETCAVRRAAAVLTALVLSGAWACMSAPAAVSDAVPAAAPLFIPPVAYVTNSADGTVTPINTATNTAGTPITVGSDPDAVAITPNGATAYVDNFNDGTVTPIHTASNTAGTPIHVGLGPWGIAITPNGATAYVTNQNSDTVTPINLAANSPGTPINVGSFPNGIAITPSGATAYVANANSGTVTPISTATNIPGPPIKVGNSPVDIAITPNGATAYVTNLGADTVTPINLATNTPGSPINVGTDTIGIAITPGGQTAYVASVGGSTVVPINLATNTAGSPISVGVVPTEIAITPNGATAYVTNQGGFHDPNRGTITPINTATNTAGPAITVGHAPFGIAITPGWTSPIRIPHGSTTTAPSLAVFRSDPGILWSRRTPRGGLTVFLSMIKNDGGLTRGKQVRGTWGSAVSVDAPAAAAYDGRLYVAWTAKAAGRIWYSDFNGRTWTRPVTIHGAWGTAASGHHPDLAVFGGLLYAAWTSRANDRILYSVYNGHSWSSPIELADADVTSVAPAITGDLATGGPVIAWTTHAGRVMLLYCFGTGTGACLQALPTAVPQARSNATPALAFMGGPAGTLYIAWKGQSGRIGYKASFDKAALTAQELLPRAVTSSGPALTVRGYTLFVAWTAAGTSGRILYTRANDPY